MMTFAMATRPVPILTKRYNLIRIMCRFGTLVLRFSLRSAILMTQLSGKTHIWIAKIYPARSERLPSNNSSSINNIDRIAPNQEKQASSLLQQLQRGRENNFLPFGVFFGRWVEAIFGNERFVFAHFFAERKNIDHLQSAL